MDMVTRIKKPRRVWPILKFGLTKPLWITINPKTVRTGNLLITSLELSFFLYLYTIKFGWTAWQTDGQMDQPAIASKRQADDFIRLAMNTLHNKTKSTHYSHDKNV
jgi:hypothetical protein